MKTTLSYYPFGLKHNAYVPTKKDVKYQELAIDEKEIKQVQPAEVVYKYKYNSKELQEELGLGVYDYGARIYDPAVPRFWTIDPLSEKYHYQSTYVYADNNPVLFRDILGMGTEDEWIIFSTGDKVKVGDKGGDKTDYIHIVDKNGNITTTSISVQKSYVSISGTEIPRLVNSEPGLRVYDATSPAIQQACVLDVAFDFVTEVVSEFSGIDASLIALGAMFINPKNVLKKGVKASKKQIRTIKGNSKRKVFIQHSSRKEALQASGQSNKVKSELHNKKTSRGQRRHYHDVRDSNIHHTWGKSKNKKG